MKEITIDLLRHGDVAGGKQLLGITDEPLTRLGLQQMLSIHANKHVPWQKIIASPLQRCHSFSKELSTILSIDLMLDKRFQEINFGQWDGKLLTDLYASEESEKLIRFMQSPDTETPPNGESYREFQLRVMTAWEELLHSLHKEEIEHCLLVTHAGVIRTIISNILGFPNTNLFKLEVPYACLSRIKQYDNYPAILSFHGGQL
ncbi:MAG: histidine phosphatase family protein [Methylophaga sp.]|nr:histidine phosphatase family protein [Methylophaga sp.]